MVVRPKLLIIGARGINRAEGGVEKFAEEFVRRARNDFDITMVALNPDVPPDCEGIEVIGVRASRILATDKLYYLLEAARLVLARRFDHVMILGINFGSIALLARLRPGRRPRVLLRSGSVDHVLPKWGAIAKAFFRFSERSARYADVVVAVAPSIQRHLARLGIRSEVIRNGVDLRAPDGPAPDRARGRLVAVGRITPQKNYRVVIEAMRHLPAEVSAVVIGGPDQSGEAEALQRLKAEHGIDNVVFAGAQSRDVVLDELARASLYVNCSIHEGMSNAILEAVQQGTPVLVSDIEANRDLGLPEHMYFDPASPERLAASVAAALEDPAAYTIPPQQFDDWDHVVQRFVAAMTPAVALVPEPYESAPVPLKHPVES